MGRAFVIKGASFADNKVSQVTFNDSIPCTSVELDESSYSVVSMSTPVTVVVTKTPSDTTDQLVLSVADPTVARIENGGLYAVGYGTTTLTATCGEETATATITVGYIEFEPYMRSSYRVQQASASGWPGDYQPLQMSSNGSYDSFADMLPDSAKHNRILSGDDYSVIMIPANTAKIKIAMVTRTGWQVYMRYASTATPASSGQNYAGFISSENLIDTNSSGSAETSSIPSGANAFAYEISHSATEYTSKVTFYPAVS